MTFPGVDRVIDAIFSEKTGYILLLLEDRLLRYQPDTGDTDTVSLPGPPLSFSEFDGGLVVGFEDAVYRVDLHSLTVGERYRVPFPARELALSANTAFLVPNHWEEEGLLALPLEGDAGAKFFLYSFFDDNMLVRRGPEGLVLFDRGSEFHQFVLDKHSGDVTEVCWRSSSVASGDQIWLHETDVFLNDGSKLALDMAGCNEGEKKEVTVSRYKMGGFPRRPTGTVRSYVEVSDREVREKSADPELVTRLPVVEIAALCARQDYLALIQDPRIGHARRELSPAEAKAPKAGTHIELFSNHLPKRLATFPLPQIEGEGWKTWGRYVFCDHTQPQLFVVLQHGSWDSQKGDWGITMVDLSALEPVISRSRKWSELIR